MKTSLLLACAVSCVISGFALPAAAQSPVASQAAPQPAGKSPNSVSASSLKPSENNIVEAPAIRGEPNVQHTVIEDKGTRIDELKVRGQVKRITVTPKANSKLQYEILPDDGTGFGDNTASQTPHGNEGRRVWNVLSF